MTFREQHIVGWSGLIRPLHLLEMNMRDKLGEIVTKENYVNGSKMHCVKCHETWTFAAKTLEFDPQRNEEYMTPSSPCCGVKMRKGEFDGG